jgi:hypothetical protein
MANNNVRDYLTIVLSNLNNINTMLEIMKNQERTMNNLLYTQTASGVRNRPVRNTPIIPTQAYNAPNNMGLGFPPINFRDVFSYAFTPNDILTARDLFRPDWGEPVVVRPTNAQITSATTQSVFSSIEQPLNTACPITQQNFASTDIVTRINRCGHVFTTTELTRWFETSVFCPLCRIDIREMRQSSSPNSTNIAPPNIAPPDESIVIEYSFT